MSNNLSKLKRLVILTGAWALLSVPAAASASITIINADFEGEGFNDPTPVSPVGGNNGTTLGEQRLIAFQRAAEIWGSELDSSVEIQILAAFNPLACNATSAVLGSAGATTIFSGFPGADYSETWYPGALADRLAGWDLNPGFPDIVALFNSDLGQPGCLTGSGWYLGLDQQHGAQIDLVTVLLHEFAHGLGFANFVNEATGSQPLNQTDIFSRFSLDTTTGLYWSNMTDSERVTSAVNTRRVVWDGDAVTEAAPDVLASGVPLLTVTAPNEIANVYAIGAASFGPPISSPGISGDVVLGLDGEGVATDACTPLTNAAEVAGKIALVDRGSCTFTTKVANAQNAGALAVLVADNAAGSPPGGLGGTDSSIVIPSARISLSDGTLIKSQLGVGVYANLGVDLSLLAGADPNGRALLYTPNPLQSGSSMSHWDSISAPNQLMEPSINSDLGHELAPPFDLTLPLMEDIGWFNDRDGVPDSEDACLDSDISLTVVIDGCDSGVANPIFTNGCTLADEVKACADRAANHGAFSSCVARLTSSLKQRSILSKNDVGAIQSCAANSSLP